MVDLRRFADRNPILLKELGELAYRPRQEYIGGGGGSADFYALGSQHSVTLERLVHAGAKIKKYLDSFFRVSITNALMLEELCPELGDLLPLFMGAALDEDGNYKRMFMEDYSCGNTVNVDEMIRLNQHRIPDIIKQFMEPEHPNYHHDDLAKAFIFVGKDEKLRIHDLDNLPWLPKYRNRVIEMRADFENTPQLLEQHLIRL